MVWFDFNLASSYLNSIFIFKIHPSIHSNIHLNICLIIMDDDNESLILFLTSGDVPFTR